MQQPPGICSGLRPPFFSQSAEPERRLFFLALPWRMTDLDGRRLPAIRRAACVSERSACAAAIFYGTFRRMDNRCSHIRRRIGLISSFSAYRRQWQSPQQPKPRRPGSSPHCPPEIPASCSLPLLSDLYFLLQGAALFIGTEEQESDNRDDCQSGDRANHIPLSGEQHAQLINHQRDGIGEYALIADGE